MEPALKPAYFARHGGKVLVLATKATLSLEKYGRLKARYGDDVISVVGTGLVDRVERGEAGTPETAAYIARLLAPYRSEQIDAVVLGCTHYPFLRKPLEALFPDAQFFDGREGTVLRLQDLLRRGGLCSDDAPGSIEYQTSGGPETLDRMRSLMRSLDEE